MLRIKNVILEWYLSKSPFKRFLAFNMAHIFMLLFTFKVFFPDAKKRINAMKNLGLINNSVLIFIDMFFTNLLFGYDPSTYASYCFQDVPLKRRLTFIPPFENKLFATSLNMSGNVDVLANKNKTYEFLNEFYGREQIVIETKNDFSTFLTFVSRHPIFFYKPLVGALGKSTGLAKADNIDLKVFFNNLIDNGSFVIEELITQCKELSSIHPSSVNSIRLNVIKTKKGTELLCGCFKCGQGGNVVDNGSAGGIFTPFDLETGRLYSTGFDENGKRFKKHPDTGIVFENFQIPRYEEVKALAIKATNKLKDINYVGWDIAISEDKVMLVEGNSLPGIQISEGLNEIGFRHEIREIARTGEILESFRNRQREMFNK